MRKGISLTNKYKTTNHNQRLLPNLKNDLLRLNFSVWFSGSKFPYPLFSKWPKLFLAFFLDSLLSYSSLDLFFLNIELSLPALVDMIMLIPPGFLYES